LFIDFLPFFSSFFLSSFLYIFSSLITTHRRCNNHLTAHFQSSLTQAPVPSLLLLYKTAAVDLSSCHKINTQNAPSQPHICLCSSDVSQQLTVNSMDKIHSEKPMKACLL
jgi:hypothetical protein